MKEAALLIGLVDEIQKQNGIEGDLFEIGVHHGRSSVVLSHFVRTPAERLAVCDIFDDQGANVSKSGQGDRDIFAAHMKRFAPTDLRLNIFAMPSDQLTIDDVGRAANRIFHVDGGHDPDEAFADLELAREATVNRGVIVLDDPFQFNWPGVAQATIEFLQKHEDFEAFAGGYNKLLFVRRDAAPMHRAAFLDPAMLRNGGLGPPVQINRRKYMSGELFVFVGRVKHIRGLALRVYQRNGWLRSVVPQSVRRFIKRLVS